MTSIRDLLEIDKTAGLCVFVYRQQLEGGFLEAAARLHGGAGGDVTQGTDGELKVVEARARAILRPIPAGATSVCL
jgi:hypothetical protein